MGGPLLDTDSVAGTARTVNGCVLAGHLSNQYRYSGSDPQFQATGWESVSQSAVPWNLQLSSSNIDLSSKVW